MLKEVKLMKNSHGYYISYTGNNFGGCTDTMEYDKCKWIYDNAEKLLNTNLKTIDFHIARHDGKPQTVRGYRLAGTDFVIHRHATYNSVWTLSHYGTGVCFREQRCSKRLDTLDDIISILCLWYDFLQTDKLDKYQIINE